VLLRKNGYIYEQVRVTSEKIKPANEQEAVLTGRYEYEMNGFMHVTYGLERYRLKKEETLKPGERQWKVHVKVSDYHQFVTEIEQ
jgi:hypothetical protein